MAIQVGSPARLVFEFRRWDENGEDLGPLDLNQAEYDPLRVVLRKPQSRVLMVIEEAEMTITDALGGIADWEAAAGEIDESGTWKAQAWAGEWPSRLRAFVVLPNLT